MLVLNPPGPAGRDKMVLDTPLLLYIPEEAFLCLLPLLLSTIPTHEKAERGMRSIPA
jgi:hypothetical protein